MSSDTQYERLIKLWISLWNLVLEENRHLETVTATLQRIVFEKRSYPHCKNWSEICKLGEVDHLMMLAVATADPRSSDERVQQLIAAFPQCFSYEQTEGPSPLSVIRMEAERKGREMTKESGGSNYPCSYGVIPEHIPVLIFDKYGNNYMEYNQPELPEHIDPETPQGEIVVYEGKELVVLENNNSCQEIWVAPAECIRVDL